MSESLLNLVSLIPSWTAATENLDIPPQPGEGELDRCVLELRGRLKDGSWKDIDFKADDEGLAVLSRFCFELWKRCSTGDSAMSEAAAAHSLVSSLAWPTDLFGERDEILSQLALAAWMHFRQFGTAQAMLVWEREYRLAFSRPSAERTRLEQFLATDASERSDSLIHGTLSDASSVFGVCELIQGYREASPAKAADEAAFFYEWFVERDLSAMNRTKPYFLGALALIAGTTHRTMGRREGAAKWLEKAQSSLGAVRNAEPDLARLAYVRLTLCYEHRQYTLVLQEIPGLLARFQRFEMTEEEIKCLYVEASALKESGRVHEALAKFLSLEARLSESDPYHLLGAVHFRIGDLYSHRGLHYLAMQKYQLAFPLISVSGRCHLSPDFKATVAGTCRDTGQFAIAADLFREAISEYGALSLNTQTAYIRILLAETLLLAGRPREAEIEILAAIPTIEKERMVEEGFTALKLLRESVERSQTDTASLRALRERLKEDTH